MGGNASSRPLHIGTASDGSNYHRYSVKGGAPHSLGYSAGGPGCGYFMSNNNFHTIDSFNHWRELPYGNGGCATSTAVDLTTSTYGYIDYSMFGNWGINGDPGIVILEWWEND